MSDANEWMLRLLLSLLVGGTIGMERTYHSRPAGFRTHALVCVASALLMLFGWHAAEWMKEFGVEGVSVDPTRVMQGIMTGIGFLGAGTIMKSDGTVRGLTTAASIWATAAVGIMIGIGFLAPALFASAVVLATLIVFRWVEERAPTQSYARVELSFDLDDAPDEDGLRTLMDKAGFRIIRLAHEIDRDRRRHTCSMFVRSRRQCCMSALVEQVRPLPQVRGLSISPWGS